MLVPRPDCCPKCGGEKDAEGWCELYCLDMDPDPPKDPRPLVEEDELCN